MSSATVSARLVARLEWSSSRRCTRKSSCWHRETVGRHRLHRLAPLPVSKVVPRMPITTVCR